MRDETGAERDEQTPEAELWGVEEDEQQLVSIDEFADLDEEGEVP